MLETKMPRMVSKQTQATEKKTGNSNMYIKVKVIFYDIRIILITTVNMLKSFFFVTAACMATASALVWDAKIIEPKAGTKLISGQTYTVKWNTEVAGMKIPDTVS